LFKSMAGVDIVHISYKGSAQSLTALLGNEVQIAFPAAGALAPHAKSGRLKALAVTSAQPSELAPGLPTITASGLPGYEATSLYGMFAPTGTPASVLTRLNHEVVKSLNRADSKEKLLRAGVEVVASTPQQLVATLKGEMTRMGKVIKDAGIRD
jgi:tripartite-type tricarboxylate transporter receptor subunit TctC